MEEQGESETKARTSRKTPRQVLRDKEKDLPPKKKPKKEGAKPAKNHVEEDDVILEQGKGTKTTGGGAGGFYWHIFNKDKKAGKVYINLIDEEPIGKHASIQIYLNKASQGRHIGRYAYAKACEASNYNEIYAHMSKKNIASYKSALAAGFENISLPGVAQRILRWKRH